MAKNALMEKIPPQNLEAEKSVLGSMLIEKEAIGKVIEILRPEDFYKEAHRKIFEAIIALYDRDEAVDLITLAEQLRAQEERSLKNIGGATYLTSLINSVSTAANVEYYAKIVRDKSLLRKLIETATNIIGSAYEDADDIEKVVDKAEYAIYKVGEGKLSSGFAPIKELMHETIETIEKYSGKKELVTGVPTGYHDFDIKTAGLHPSNLIIIAGRPSMGKTSFCLGMALHVALEVKVPVAIFTLEMSREEVSLRMICSLARVEMQKVRGGFLGKNDWVRITNAASRIMESPIFIDDSPSLSVLEIKARARRLKSEHRGLGLIIVDYLQLMPGRTGRVEYRQQDISEITRALKILSKELKVPVVALSQLSRAPEKRGPEKRPQLSDLRESGAIEQDADLVAFIYREEYYDRLFNRETTPEDKGVAEVIIGKQRNGPTGMVKLAFIEQYTRFDDLARQPEVMVER